MTAGKPSSAARFEPGPPVLLDRVGLQGLIDVLVDSGHQVVGPTVQDDAIIYGPIRQVADLPIGWTDRHAPGRYQLERNDDATLFGFNVGPHSWKRFLHPPRETLWTARTDGSRLTLSRPDAPAPKFAFIGVRACELQAIAIQDQVFLEGPYRNVPYQERRATAFLVAVNCGQASATCFCTSMDSGPAATTGYDLVLTELRGGTEACLAVAGSEAGAVILGQLPQQPATETHVAAAAAIVARTAGEMGRRLDTTGLKEALQSQPNHPRWDDVAARCLACGNCTMVCPTCFCTTVSDHTDLPGVTAERVRSWDSCFTLDFSYLHGGSVRQSTGSRYRQWMTHKLAGWIDQFGTAGCVGCGRCISWCPVGIDITVEAEAIRSTPTTARGSHRGGD